MELIGLIFIINYSYSKYSVSQIMIINAHLYTRISKLPTNFKLIHILPYPSCVVILMARCGFRNIIIALFRGKTIGESLYFDAVAVVGWEVVGLCLTYIWQSTCCFRIIREPRSQLVCLVGNMVILPKVLRRGKGGEWQVSRTSRW